MNGETRLGPRGRRFKSCRPDHEAAGQRPDHSLSDQASRLCDRRLTAVSNVPTGVDRCLWISLLTREFSVNGPLSAHVFK